MPPASLNSVSTFCDVRCGAPETVSASESTRRQRSKIIPDLLATRSTKGTNAFTKTFVLLVPFVAKKTLEDKPEGELHLAPPLLADVAPELVLVIQVSLRERTIHPVQHVI